MCLQLDDLFGNLSEMVEFQVEFLQTLEDGIRLVPDLDRLEGVEDFKVVMVPFCFTLKICCFWCFTQHMAHRESVVLHASFTNIILS